MTTPEVQISREYWFSASHRIEGHPKCGRLHGHNYKVTVYVAGGIDVHGMVFDYGDLDKIVKPIIDETLDHKHMISNENRQASDQLIPVSDRMGWSVHLPVTATTAECLSIFLLKTLRNVHEGIIAVRIDETPKSSALAAL